MEEKVVITTAELSVQIAALKKEMQKKGYSPASMVGLEQVWKALEEYVSSVPPMPFNGECGYPF